MEIFSKKQSYLGVDIGSSSIKVVELTKKNNLAQLKTYGYTEEQTDIIKSSGLESQAKVSALLKAVCAKARVSTQKALAALPNFFVFSSIINLPAVANKKELESAINWEAKKFVPMPLEEVVLDWKVLTSQNKSISGMITKKEAEKTPLPNLPLTKSTASPLPGPGLSPNPEPSPPSPLNNPPVNEKHSQFRGAEIEPADSNSQKNPNQNSPSSQAREKSTGEILNVLLTAAPKNLVKRYIDICQAAGLKLLSLETESFALARSLLGVTSEPVIIIDMGALVSDIVILEQGIPILSRSIDVGGNTITQSIMNVLGIDANRAEQFKRDFGAPLSAGLNTFLTPSSSSDKFSGSGVPRAIGTVLDTLMQEIRYSIELYQNQTSKKAEKVILSGGSAFLPHFTEYLSQKLSLPVYIGNPWDRVSYPEELKSVLENLAPRLAVAVGLALKELA